MPLRTARADMRLIADLLTLAEREAHSLGDPEPAAEHLLVAALLLDDSSAREALAVDADAVRNAIAEVHAASLASLGIEGEPLESIVPPAGGLYRAEVSAQEVFQRARALAKSSTTGLRSAHVVMAIAEREHGTVARVLQHLGLDRAAVTTAALDATASR